MTQDIQIREATPADKGAVLNIRDDVYGGRDYLPAFYDNFMTSPLTKTFVLLYKGKTVSSSSATIIDGGETVVARAGRVSKDHEGTGFSRMMRDYIEEWARKQNIYRKVTVAQEEHLADVSKPSFTKIHKHILTKECLQYRVMPASFTIPDVDVKKAQRLCTVTDSQLAGLIRSKPAREYLFPKDRIVLNSVPYRVMEANIPAIREQKDITVIFSDVNFTYLQPKGVMSIGSHYPVPKPGYAYNIELYGSDYDSIRSHIVRHLLRLKQHTSVSTAIFVFVDEGFPFDVIDKIFLDYEIPRNLWQEQTTKRMMFERVLEPRSQY